MKLNGKKALVTGSSRGIGKAIALELAKEGADVGINYQTNELAAQEVASEIEQLGRKSVLFRASVANENEVCQMIKDFTSEFGKIDILVANAGIVKDQILLKMKLEDFTSVIETNLTGTFLLLKEAGKKMLRQKYGRIVTISSISAIMGNVGQGNYSASKAGIIALTKTFAREFAQRDIVANVVAPGWISTDMTSLSEEVKQQVLSYIPKGEFGTPEDVAKLVSFLASEDAKYITGQVFSVNGGMLM